ncbi:uncharacterized protein A4U43_C05F29600 [Asparagus officinalis]|uniref:V-type proton ATPase subunit C n=1 Tax=Asparagus officinalis TaxID=4686 RepID=A0A5P1EXW6_ASPOF|nr:uncharacterized protein A4U43_C05F29600 [Asparagus officinalis]
MVVALPVQSSAASLWSRLQDSVSKQAFDTLQSSAASLWSRLQDSVSKQAFDTPLNRFNIPDLHVGTLDSLLALSEMHKLDMSNLAQFPPTSGSYVC